MEGLMVSEAVTAASYKELRLQIRTLILFRGVLEDEVGQRVRVLLDFLAQGEEARETEFDVAVEEFSRFTATLLARAMEGSAELTGDLWQSYLLDRILADVNPFSITAERSQKQELGMALLHHQVRSELQILQALHSLSLKRLQKAVLGVSSRGEGLLQEGWPFSGRSEPLLRQVSQDADKSRELKGLMTKTTDWADLVDTLAGHYAWEGTGMFSRYWVFRWIVKNGVGSLEGIPVPDPVSFDDIVGYEREREAVLRNTRHFVKGFPANNVLLYGDSGTGKSSLVKALVNSFGDHGLRLVEVPKEHLIDFTYIARQLRDRKERFIIFVDDFSFEEHETEYKALKALMEGSVEARPDNVLVYATSNRRHLVKEHFGDRSPSSIEEVHPMETMQEKLSLADRFGIRVAFLAPDEECYLAIVTALAQRQGLMLPQEELRRRALHWAQLQHGISGRTARQFIDDLVGVLAEEEASGRVSEVGERG